MADKHFFDTVRPLFGRLLQHQVDGCNKIIEYAADHRVSRVHLAYILATVYHETGRWMQPIREGALRYGPDYSDASARNAVAVLHAKGIIRRNYALPEPNGHSYYGRGLVQITWPDNYKQFGVYDDPDTALEWETALRILFEGMLHGKFTGKSLLDATDYKSARAVVNGDVRRNGARIARYAETFYNALENYVPEPKKEVKHGPRKLEGAWPPRWWPFQVD